jgi:hypothetical protein
VPVPAIKQSQAICINNAPDIEQRYKLIECKTLRS